MPGDAVRSAPTASTRRSRRPTGSRASAVDPSGTRPDQHEQRRRKDDQRDRDRQRRARNERARASTEVGYPNPGAPTLSAGTQPERQRPVHAAWTGADPLQYFGLSYTLQHHNADRPNGSNVATGIEALDYEFTGAGEEEGTWEYRVQGTRPVGTRRRPNGRPPRRRSRSTRRAPNAPSGVRRPRPRLRRRRRLVQGHRQSVLHRQRRPAAVRRQRGQRRQPGLAVRAADVQHRRLARSERHGRRQRRQRLARRAR